MALLARARTAVKFALLVIGTECGMPAGWRTTCPDPVAPRTVRFAATALAVGGMPQAPAIAKVSNSPEASGEDARVSSTRHGVTVWKSSGGVETVERVGSPGSGRPGSLLTPVFSLMPSPLAS